MSRFAIVAILGIGLMAVIGGSLLDFQYAIDEKIGLKDSMQAFISVVLLLASIFVVLTKRYQEKDRNWAYGTIGALIGFWLRS